MSGCLSTSVPVTQAPLLSGQRALVTAGDSGVGAAIAESLALAGAHVALHYHERPGPARYAVEAIRGAGGEAIALQADVGREACVGALIEQVVEGLGDLDILITNALPQRELRFLEIPCEDWEAVMRANLTGPFLCARAAARVFLRRGVVPGRSPAAGKIIFIAGRIDGCTPAEHGPEAAAMGSVQVLTRALARTLAPHKVRVNGIVPGLIKGGNHRLAQTTPEQEGEVLERIPYGRFGSTGDVANAALWLASDVSDYMTGALLPVDGGLTLSAGMPNLI